jgi:hypothetical protein
MQSPAWIVFKRSFNAWISVFASLGFSSGLASSYQNWFFDKILSLRMERNPPREVERRAWWRQCPAASCGPRVDATTLRR